jgi:O-antigen/teichoic acid export membrane protein
MQVTVIVVQVLVALVWPSPWALVAGAWLGSGGKALCSHFFLERQLPRFRWDPSAVRELFSFGSWIFASTALTFINANGDRLLLGALVPMSQLGVYAVATRLQGALLGFLGTLVRKVMYPFIAERRRALEGMDAEELTAHLAALYYRTRLRTDALFVTASGVLIVFSGVLVNILYTDAYVGAGPALMILAVKVALKTVSGSAESVLTTIGDTKHYFLQTSGRLVVMLVGLPLGWWLFGFWGIVWATTLSEVPAIYVVMTRMKNRGLLRVWQEARALLFLAAGLVIGFVLECLATPFLD